MPTGAWLPNMKVGGEERRDQEEGLASVAIKITDYAPAYGTTGTEAGRTDQVLKEGASNGRKVTRRAKQLSRTLIVNWNLEFQIVKLLSA